MLRKMMTIALTMAITTIMAVTPMQAKAVFKTDQTTEEICVEIEKMEEDGTINFRSKNEMYDLMKIYAMFDGKWEAFSLSSTSTPKCGPYVSYEYVVVGIYAGNDRWTVNTITCATYPDDTYDITVSRWSDTECYLTEDELVETFGHMVDF
jgi:hypothetical protein